MHSRGSSSAVERVSTLALSIASDARRRGSASRCAYRCAVDARLCPNNLPMALYVAGAAEIEKSIPDKTQPLILYCNGLFCGSTWPDLVLLSVISMRARQPGATCREVLERPRSFLGLRSPFFAGSMINFATVIVMGSLRSTSPSLLAASNAAAKFGISSGPNADR
jgi:hypothetical protein